jgi:hypothetical protein
MRQNKITILQYSTLAFFLFNSFLMNIGYHNLTATTYNDSILDIIVGSILFFLFSIFIFRFKIYSKHDIFNITYSYPKIIRFILSFIIVILISTVSIYSLSILTSFIHFYILKEVDILIISITLGITILYIVSKNLPTICKISELFFYIYIFLFLVSTICLIKYIDLSNLKPLFTTSLNDNITATSTYFISFIIPLFLLSMIPIKQIEFNKKNKNLIFIFILFSFIIILIEVILSISILGINLVNIYKLPNMIIYKKISFLNVLERMEVLLALNNILNSLFFIIICIYFIKEFINKIIIRKKEPITLALIILILIILSNLFTISMDIYLLISLLLLGLSFILIFINQYKHKNH